MLFLGMSLSGCVTMADPDASQEYNSDAVGVVNPQTSLGQSFVSQRPNFNGITFWLTYPSGQSNKPVNSIDNSIKVKLFHDPSESTPVFSTTIDTPTSGTNIPITINLPNQKNLSGQNFYLLLSVNSGSIQINGRNEEAYPLGQAYINGNAINADIAFRLTYSYDLNALWQDFKQFAANSWIIFPLLILLWLPGWLCIDISGFRSHIDFGAQTAISLGISLALIPVIMLWTTILKIKWSRAGVVFVAGFLITLWVVRMIYVLITSINNHANLANSQSNDEMAPQSKAVNAIKINTIALMLIFLSSLAVRLIMIRDLATPAWVDSVHHALITRLILDAGGYPSTFLPYLNISTTVYHLGFHSIAAAFVWLSNLDLAHALLILGQVLNALSIFSVYLFTITLTRSSSAGIFAAFITGFLTPMPAYYTSWGRYTELTGLLILPVVLALAQLWLDEKTKKRNVWVILLGAIAAGGLFMVHYRVIIFLASLIFSFVIFEIVFGKKARRFKPGHFLLVLISMAVLGIISIFPWFYQTIKLIILSKISLPVNTSVSFFQDFSWPYLTSALGKQALVMASLGLLWSMIKRRGLIFIILLWLFSLFFLANLNAFNLPFAGLITNLSVEIMLFIPISILGGYLIDQILNNWKDFIPKQLILPSVGIICLLFGIVAYLGAKQLIPILNPVTILSRNADLTAIEWINEHIPEHETIVINPFAWGYGLYAGNDGGYWISPLSGRLTLPPPVLYGLGSGVKDLNQTIQNVITNNADPAKLWEFLTSQRLHFIYIGARGGIIPPEKLFSSGLYDLLYHQDGVWIFSVKP
jgi:hypothetical protein